MKTMSNRTIFIAFVQNSKDNLLTTSHVSNPTVWLGILYHVLHPTVEEPNQRVIRADCSVCVGSLQLGDELERLILSFLLLVAMPGAPSSVLAPSSKARSP